MDLVLCHITADFDTLGAAIGLTRLNPGARIVLTGGCHPTVQNFLAFHRDEYTLIERRAVNVAQMRSLMVVDTQRRDRLGAAAPWIEHAQATQCPIWLYDHHLNIASDIPATHRQVEAVGATTTLIVEALQAAEMTVTVAEATAMALGIHVDTGSLTFEQTTVRDVQALAWLMIQGANLRAIAEFVEPGLSPQLQDLLPIALERLTTEIHHGARFSWLLIEIAAYVPGLSSLVSRLVSLTDSDVMLLGAYYPISGEDHKLMIIGRSRLHTTAHSGGLTGGLNFQTLLQPFGGGGHAAAAAATLRTATPQSIFDQLVDQSRNQIPHPPNARDLMSSPVRTIRPQTTISEAQRILLRYGHSGLSVVDAEDQLVGIISRRDIDLALHHGFSHAPVKGYMTSRVKTIAPETPLPDIEALMVTYDIGRLPVLDNSNLIGIVTRTDVLRQLHQDKAGDQTRLVAPSIAIEGINTNRREPPNRPNNSPDAVITAPESESLIRRLAQALQPELWSILQKISHEASQQGWHLYLVGGAVRDLLLTPSAQPIALHDIDLVVDGFYQRVEIGAGVALANVIRQRYPDVELQTYGKFQTAALVWHDHPQLGPLMIDIATARTEFYPYPAANPEVEASSIRQDLYRRDFTINAMALRLNEPKPGVLLDFFGGRFDLAQGQIRVLHANSFIEDPTRIYRAVRFAVRLGFNLEVQTEGFIHHAIDSGIYAKMQAQVAEVPALQTRLKRELKYIFAADYWQSALSLLDKLGALKCLHSSLAMSDRLWHQLRRITRWMERFQFQTQLIPWQMRLEVLLTQLAPVVRRQVAQNLQLSDDSIDRLTHIEDAETHLTTVLLNCDRPSQIAQHLRDRDLATLLLISARHPRPLGQKIWIYLTTWAAVKAPLNGHDLKQLGYHPGENFKVLLDALLNATLDGQIARRDQAVAFLETHYPLK
ncbi:MAG: CBS domain-containing protein [Cyanobacteria bacterium P01_A01_bin.123]